MALANELVNLDLENQWVLTSQKEISRHEEPGGWCPGLNQPPDHTPSLRGVQKTEERAELNLDCGGCYLPPAWAPQHASYKEKDGEWSGRQENGP